MKNNIKSKAKRIILSILGSVFCFSMVMGLSGCAILEQLGLITPNGSKEVEFGYTYNQNYNGYTISSAKNASGKIDIPEYYEIEGRSYPIIAISDNVFKENKAITEVTIPARVVTIGKYAFSKCTALKKVTFADYSELQTIRSYAFGDCSVLEKFNMPENVVSIENNAFQNCKKLENVVLPETLQSLGSSVFYDCDSITEIEIPADITVINGWTFYHCNSLSSVTFAEGTVCSRFNDYAFRQCGSLVGMVIPSSVKHIGTYTFYACDDLEWITFGNPDDLDFSTLENINSNAFNECYNLRMINLPASLKTIGSPFHQCTSLESITYEGTVAEWELVTKSSSWVGSAPALYLYCRGGVIPLK